MHVIGSGAQYLYEIVSMAQEKSGEFDAATKGLKALSASLVVCGQLNANEYHNAQNLYNYFGGSYEIALWAGSEYKKVDEVTYLNWIISEENGYCDICFTGMALKNFYISDVMISRKFQVILGSDEKDDNFKDDFYLILPLFTPHEMYE